MDNRPIGVFDTGLGGLTAVKELLQSMPGEDLIYFGDTGRVPYGTRSRETILRYAQQDVRFMRSFDIKALVIACGTVSANALDELVGSFDMPIIGVVRPAASRAARLTKNRKIGVIGTSATIKSGAYERLLREYAPDAAVYSQACPLLVPLVENGRFERGDRVAELVAAEYLAPLRAAGVDTLILGCTHYPLLTDIIADIMGGDVALVNSGAESAGYVRSVLSMTEKLSCFGRPGTCRYFVSDSVEDFSRYASMYLERGIEGSVEYVDIERF